MANQNYIKIGVLTLSFEINLVFTFCLFVEAKMSFSTRNKFLLMVLKID